MITISSILAFVAPMLFKPAAPQSDAPPKVGSIGHMIAWLETKNPSEQYNWRDPSRCLYGQYGHRYMPKRKRFGLTPYAWAVEVCSGRPGSVERERQTFGDLGSRGEHTFGAALARAKEWQRRHR